MEDEGPFRPGDQGKQGWEGEHPPPCRQDCHTAAGGASGNSMFVMVSGILNVGTCRIGERVLLRTVDRNDTLRAVEVG